jgi:hypothetical protein
MTMQWDPTRGEFTLPAAGAPGAIMGDFDYGDITPSARYAMALQTAFPQAAQRPGLARALNRASPFLYSDYLMGISPEAMTAGSTVEAPTFGQWLLGRQQHMPAVATEQLFGGAYPGDEATGGMGGTYGLGETRWGGLQGGPLGQGVPTGWANMINVARQMGTTGGGFTAAGVDQDVFDRYSDILSRPGAPEAFSQIATSADPRMAGSAVAGMRARAMGRERERWDIMRGGTGTEADWLGYITGQGGLARQGYQIA